MLNKWELIGSSYECEWIDYNVSVDSDTLCVTVEITEADTVPHLALNDYAEWTQYYWGYEISPKAENEYEKKNNLDKILWVLDTPKLIFNK